jgi:pimeloyl-ACP methyl ester carboxylesterase
MPEVELTAGIVEYDDTGGQGPVLVFLHGLMMDSSLWRRVVPGLSPDYRCVLPTLPLGGHRRAMRPEADLSLPGMARLVAEFIDRVGLTDVTLVQNDWGGAQILIAVGDTSRIGRLIITSSEAFGNYPPRPARVIVLAAAIPGGLAAMMTLLRLRAVRRAPGSWGWMSKRPVPGAVMDAWFQPVTTDPAIRRDLAKYVTSVPSRRVLLDWARRSAGFGRPVLVAWATEDRMMPRQHGRRLAELFPDARLVEIDDSYTLIPEDQPEQLTRVIQDFVPASTPPSCLP